MNLLDQALAAAVLVTWRSIIPRIPPDVVRVLARTLFSKSWGRFQRATAQPAEAQKSRLLEIIDRNRDTVFGREHGFGDIRSIADFRSRVPIMRYEDLEPYIKRMMRGEKNVLLADEVKFFARTSGTTGAAKYIPVTQTYLEEYRAGRRIWLRQVAQVFPGLVRGTLLTMHSPKIEGRTESGIPFGSITVAMGASDQGGQTGRLPLLSPLQKIPMRIFFLEDFETKYYALLRTAVETDIAMMAAINPSTLILMCQKLTEFAPAIIEDCEKGSIRSDLDLGQELRAELESRFKPAPEIAQRLRASLAAHGRVRPIDIWPNLCGLLSWKGGSAPFYLRQFPEWFGQLPVMDYGYAATEGSFSIVMSAEGSKGVANVMGHFLEFIPEERRHESAPPVLNLDELEIGKRYYVLITGSHGLMRYDINDVVEVVGRYKNTPEIVFCHKGGNMISYTGEKIGESHVVMAVSGAQEQCDIDLNGFLVTVRTDSATPRYIFAVEPSSGANEADLRALLHACEAGLRDANIEYAAKRDSNRLADPWLQVVSTGAFERTRKARIDAGAFDSHVKVPHLAQDPGEVAKMGIERTVTW
ncbi:MAG: GH3 auxin-responsive promoter family protein [Deltaproteobacteria bacterium]|nr:GH3 auxin-responsive promoter family protein [Deltaproteobacteria bacterium]